ncbi:TlpA family protein disulfide reductase [Parenemella sanctibonifatiensis]|uniref:Thioredoxin n=1 Tax=Parenemella sanctibonifatiensis TaxID=2016505 RepID=A0A255DZJ0_9ACTN|nr:TlpA disulfide reductase family protein [Parenemella sanctibonifatiensis]OYN84666.1 thioredoxin [Parenemella sanctibonifatiensis]
MLAAAVAAPVALAACSADGEQRTSEPGSGYVGGSGVTTIAEDRRTPAPRLTGTDLDDNPISLPEPGRAIVLNVWGSWCAPCRKEAPDLVTAAAELADRADFFGINNRDLNPAQARAFVRTFEIPYPSFYDPDGRLLLEFADHVPPGAIPSTIIIDRQGRIAARVLGVISATSLVQLVDEVAS